MLSIENITVKIKDSDQEILKDFSLSIGEGEVHAIMGPNGTGKSTLAKVIMGHYKYEITEGSLFFYSDDITNMDVDLRAKKGIFLGMQDPTEIEGVTNSEFLRTALKEITGEKTNLYTFIQEVEKGMKDLKLSDTMLHRFLNKGFSGGEKKKNEILQLKVLKPKFIILDEIDSGLDVDSLKIVAENVNAYLKENPSTSLLMITHYPRILEYIHPDYVHIMQNGKIEKTGDILLARSVEKNGYHSINVIDKEDIYE